MKYRIELQAEAESPPHRRGKFDRRWTGDLQKNHGTDDEPEWWGVETYEGTLSSVMADAKLGVAVEEGEPAG